MSQRSCHKGGSTLGLQQSATLPISIVTVADVGGIDRPRWVVRDDDEKYWLKFLEKALD
jgi:hypothetical protein